MSLTCPVKYVLASPGHACEHHPSVSCGAEARLLKAFVSASAQGRCRARVRTIQRPQQKPRHATSAIGARPWKIKMPDSSGAEPITKNYKK